MIKPYYETELGKLYHGDCLEIMRELESDSVQCCVTSPPYWGLRDYGLPPQIWDGDSDCEHDFKIEIIKEQTKISNKTGLHNDGRKNPITEKYRETLDSMTLKKFERGFCSKCNAWKGTFGLEPTPELYIKHGVEIFREVRRILRPDGTLWLNMGDSYATQSGTYGGEEKYKGLQANMGTASAQKQKKPAEIGLKHKDLCGIPWRLALALQADGWYLRSDIIWSKPNPMPESVTDRPTKAHEYLFLMSKNAKYYYDAEAVREGGPTYTRKAGGYYGRDGINASRFAGKGGFGDSDITTIGRNKRSVWTIPTQPFPEAHFATFPEKLVIPCIMAGTSEKGNCSVCGKPWMRVTESEKSFESGSGKSGNLIYGKNKEKCQGGGDTGDIRKGPVIHTKTLGWQPSCDCGGEPTKPIVLDPFMGSGTVGAVCEKYGRRWIGCELSKEYCDIAVERIKRETKQPKLELT